MKLWRVFFDTKHGAHRQRWAPTRLQALALIEQLNAEHLNVSKKPERFEFDNDSREGVAQTLNIVERQREVKGGK